jgi:hypothetical protein
VTTAISTAIPGRDDEEAMRSAGNLEVGDKDQEKDERRFV